MEVNPAVPVTSAPEFIAYAKANPGKINFASGGVVGRAHPRRQAARARGNQDGALGGPVETGIVLEPDRDKAEAAAKEAIEHRPFAWNAPRERRPTTTPRARRALKGASGPGASFNPRRRRWHRRCRRACVPRSRARRHC